MKFSNFTGIDLQLYFGVSKMEEPDATFELKHEDSQDVPDHIFDTVLIKKKEETN